MPTPTPEPVQLPLASLALGAQVRRVIEKFPMIELGLLFGSVAAGLQRPDSDLDIAVAANRRLTAEEKMDIIASLAEATGRPIDLVDLRQAGEPLLGQILTHGWRLMGSDLAYAPWITRHVLNQADFVPYRNRVLAERRAAWIGQ
jgi:predicted nucleotidyltransferase